MNPFRGWWNNFLFNRHYGFLKEQAGYRLLTLWAEETPGEVKEWRVGGRIYRDEVLRMELLAENAQAWEKILAEPSAARLALTCKKCHCAHVFISNRPLGRFSDKNQGAWSSEWFRLIRPGLASSASSRTLNCPRCLKREKASLRFL